MSINLTNALACLSDNKGTLNHIIVDPKKAAIENHEPLVLVNAGNNVGRFGVMLRRLDYMTSSNIDYTSIMVVHPTEADVENFAATNRFTSSMTINQLASRIKNGYPVAHKHIIINGIDDDQQDDLITIFQFAGENGQSLFIIDDATRTNMMKWLIDSDVFTVYNL